MEKLRKVRIQVWPNAQKLDDAFNSTLRQWTNNPARPIREKLDIVEIVDFIWGFVGRKAFHVSDVPSWLEGEDDLVRDQYIDQWKRSWEWGFFVRGVIQFLRPPQIIQLVLSSWYPSSWNFDRSGFLRNLGPFDTWNGVLVNERDFPMSDNWVPLDILDNDVGNSLAHMGNAKEVEKKWEKYREVL